MNTLDFASRVKIRREQLKLSQAELARLVGISQVAIRKIEGGGKTRHGRLLAAALGVSLTYLETGAELDSATALDQRPKHGPEGAQRGAWPFPRIPESEVRALPHTQLSALEGAIALAIAQLKLGITVCAPPIQREPAGTQIRGALVDLDAAADEFQMRVGGQAADSWENDRLPSPITFNSRPLQVEAGLTSNVAPANPYAANDIFEEVQELADVRLAAGDGIENHEVEQTGVMQFRRSFLLSVGADGGRACVVYAKGDSMEPTIRDGAALLVVPDEGLSLRDLAAGGVYAINYEGKMIVKTLTKDPLTRRWVARSINPKYHDIPLEDGARVRVLGRVVWTGSRLHENDATQWVRP